MAAAPRARSCRRRRKGNASGPVARRTWLRADFHVLIEGGEHPHQALDRIAAEPSSKNMRQVGLADADLLGRRSLVELALLDEPPKLDDDVRLDQLVLGVRQAEVGENVDAAEVNLGFFCACHCYLPSNCLLWFSCAIS